ncbi:MAG: type II toxin-antitoxin system mRNA interferase toxin, RelE/StbE family [Gammaproteobacteria bacterium]|nr:type II toxin-antitoxin system mRNA interferase toxin, RelE/StbE family [Gammaproteobacteria bacterium]
MDIHEVKLSKQTEKDLKTIPIHIAFKLQAWIDGIKNEGIIEMRKRPGFHDEPLKGKRKGQRSIRLNKAYRAIYEIGTSGTVHFIEVTEVNKHEY